MFRQLVAGGLLEVDVDGYGGMRLAGDAAKVLRGERAVRAAPRSEAGARPAPRQGRAKAAPVGLARRRPTAICSRRSAPSAASSPSDGLPPFMVFPDRTLIELAVKKPADLAALDTIHGIGQAKRERWGEEFLGVIRDLTGTALSGR